MAGLSVQVQERMARMVANLLLVVLVVVLGVELAKITWLFAWNDRPVPEIYGQASGPASGPAGGELASVAGYEFFGRPEGQA
ncbi:MAG: hypothetical protein ACPHWU_07785, partial [Marinobacter vinifirmus]